MCRTLETTWNNEISFETRQCIERAAEEDRSIHHVLAAWPGDCMGCHKKNWIEEWKYMLCGIVNEFIILMGIIFWNSFGMSQGVSFWLVWCNFRQGKWCCLQQQLNLSISHAMSLATLIRKETQQLSLYTVWNTLWISVYRMLDSKFTYWEMLMTLQEEQSAWYGTILSASISLMRDWCAGRAKPWH